MPKKIDSALKDNHLGRSAAGAFDTLPCARGGSPAQRELKFIKVHIWLAPRKPNVGMWQSAIYLILIQFCFTSCFASQRAGLGLPKRGWNEEEQEVPESACISSPVFARPAGRKPFSRIHHSLCGACLTHSTTASLSPRWRAYLSALSEITQFSKVSGGL